MHQTANIIVGADDLPVIRVNEQAYEQLGCERQLSIIPGAGHLFEERGTLEEVTRLAIKWFHRHLDGPTVTAPTTSA